MARIISEISTSTSVKAGLLPGLNLPIFTKLNASAVDFNSTSGICDYDTGHISIRSGQFDDMEGPAQRILMDDDDPMIPRRTLRDGEK